MASKALVFLVLALAVAVTVVDCNSESDALYEWRTNVVDPNNVLQSWDWTLVNPCSWLHITCNNQNSVTSVQLGVAGLSGPLLPVLGQLSNLQYLELYGNQFSGPIPSAIGNLTSLISLDLYNNQLSGVIPSTFGNLKSLRFMRLNSNNLSGQIPDQVFHLIQWRNLEILNVSDNNLAGSAQRHPNTKNLFSVTTIVQDAKA